MGTTVYLIRHAQSHPSTEEDNSQWPLSIRGKEQASALGPLLEILKIEKLYSSPYTRCLETVRPFTERNRLNVFIDKDLQERLIAKSLLANFQEVWTRSWHDFDFALPDCESSSAAQRRFCKTVQTIVQQNPGSTLGISSHGNVIALLLNHLDKSYSQDDADKLRNPEVVKIVATGNGLAWDSAFSLPGLDEIATPQCETPIKFSSAIFAVNI